MPTDCQHRTHYLQELVDKITWLWARNLILDPQKLEVGWGNYQAEQEKRIKPILQQLEILEEGIAKNEESLAMLLDLYLSGEFDRTILIERKQRLEEIVADLNRQRDERLAELNAERVTIEQIQEVQRFCIEVRDGVLEVDEMADFEARRYLIDLLNVHGTFWFEDGKRKLKLHCILGEDTVFVSQDSCIRASL